MALRDDLLALAPEIADNSRVDLFLGYAALRVNRRIFSGKADFATLLLAAHMLTRFSADMSAGVSGAVTMEKVGDLQTQYGRLGLAGDGDDELNTTTYGAHFVSLRRGLLTTPLVV